MKTKFLATVIVGFILLNSCSDATRSQMGGYGSEHKVELYSGGILVREWISTGKVQSSSSSDGYYFNEKECDCNVEVSGDIVITRL